MLQIQVSETKIKSPAMTIIKKDLCNCVTCRMTDDHIHASSKRAL